MKNPIRMVDEALMAAADGLVQLAWDRLEVRRIWLILTALAAQSIGAAAKGQWVALGVFGFVGLLEALASKRSPKSLNAVLAAYRGGAFPMTIRIGLTAMWAVDIVSAIATADGEKGWRAVAATSYVLLTWTFTPEDPPKRRREVKLAAARGVA
jgi:hypothetical protein